MKNFRFNKIILIQSLSPEHENSPLGKPGPALYDTIIKRLDHLKSQKEINEDVTCDYLKIYSLNEWNILVGRLIAESKNGLCPILHFICHGDKDEGMSIWDMNANAYMELEWRALFSSFKDINVNTHNNLFVSMCVCEAFWSLLNLFSDEQIPFAGIVASPDSIFAIDAEIRFPVFYDALLSNRDIQSAKQKLEEDYKRVAALIGEKSAFIHVCFSDELFMNAYKKEIERRKDPNYLRKRAVEGLQAGGLTPTEDDIRLFIDDYFSHYQEDYRRIRDKKFMIDLYPEERDRYDFPDEV